MAAERASSSTFSSRYRLCGCGDTMLLLTTTSAKNPGRKFWRCPNWNRKDTCNYFEWLEEEVDGADATSHHCVHCSDMVLRSWTLKIAKLKENRQRNGNGNEYYVFGYEI
ncbi:Zinc finger, GRF-type [Sesbania bispinosa]|nr:Zinc finger, GRF-type [Sesbania bispinosa]